MSANRLQMAVLVFLIGTMLSCVCSGTWLLGGETNIITALASFNTVQFNFLNSLTIAKPLGQFFSAIITALTWDYPFLGSPWALFIKFPLWLISIGVIWAIVDGFSTILSGITGAVSNLVR